MGRFSGKGQYAHGFAKMTVNGARWTGKVALIPEMLERPLHWRRPRWIFANSTSDLFHENLSDAEIASVFGVMAACPQHHFLILTKREARMEEWLNKAGIAQDVSDATKRFVKTAPPNFKVYPIGPEGCFGWRWFAPWPLPNVRLGVSVESQEYADRRIPHLLRIGAPQKFTRKVAAVGDAGTEESTWTRPGWKTMLSLEPLLGPVVLPEAFLALGRSTWAIGGLESGPNARPGDVAWLRALQRQCAGHVPWFCKQFGARPYDSGGVPWATGKLPPFEEFALHLRDRKGGDMTEWSPDMCVREYPDA